MKNNSQFINELKSKFGDILDYTNVVYKGTHSKIELKCIKCGNLIMKTPRDLLYRIKKGNVCNICHYNNKLKNNKLIFIEKSKNIHNHKYDYSKVDYVNSKTKVCIICPEHGEFWQIPNSHLNGNGCPYCKNENNRGNTQNFIEKAKLIHNNYYDYSLTVYGMTNREYVNVICPKHGIFKITPKSHLAGCGCRLCKRSWLEKDIANFLTNNNINFVTQKTFNWLRNSHHNLYLDFYLPEYNIAIECQGEQHFKPIQYYGGNIKFNTIIENDEIKKDLCDKHNIKIIYKSNTKNCPNKIYKNWTKYIIFLKNEEILKEIKSENEK